MESKVKIRTTLEPMYRSVDMKGRIVDCNDKYAEVLGYIKDEIIGSAIFDHTPKDRAEEIRTIFENWKAKKPIHNRRFWLQTKTGKTIEVMITVSDMLGKDGRVIRSNTTLLDYKEVCRLQDKVMLSKYESLYEESPDMYRTVNVNGVIIDCNKSYHQRMGYTKEEVIGHNLVDHTADKSVSDMLINMARWRTTGTSPPIEAWMKRKDGSEFHTRIVPTNLYDDDGALIGRNVVIQDRSEIDEQKAIIEERKRIAQMKDEFLTGITHELKTPLTPIIGFSQALAKPGMLGDMNPKQINAINTVLRNAQHLKQLVSDLLDVHKLELGKMKFTIQEFDLEELINGVRSSVQNSANEKSIKLVFQVNATGKIVGDQLRLAEVLTNLLYNALDFTPTDTGRVVVKVDRDEKSWVFSVSDNGVGIPKNKQSHLFKKFYQVSTSVTRRYGGTGLGLSICKGLVEGMGGSIRVKSDEGVGSTFTFNMPVREV